MRILKLVIWDLDETILTGILEEGDGKANAAALNAMTRLRARGTLQALATHNQPEVFRAAKDKYEWTGLFVQVEADLGPKVKMLRRILNRLSVDPLDAAFVDEDPFERDSIAFQLPGISAWSVANLQTYLDNHPGTVTEEGYRRPEMYAEQQARSRDEEAAPDYLSFLRSCDIHIKIRPFVSNDAERVKELLARTHRMNLGVLSLDEAASRLEQTGQHSVVIAEMRDSYGDMGRCGVLHLRPDGVDRAVIESLAISCRTRARGLSLSMLVGLLRHPSAAFEQLGCRYVFNGSNRPLRMLLMAAGFRRQPGAEELVLSADHLANTVLPDWIHISY
jgi:methoxymalonate biosynthesis protein